MNCITFIQIILLLVLMLSKFVHGFIFQRSSLSKSKNILFLRRSLQPIQTLRFASSSTNVELQSTELNVKSDSYESLSQKLQNKARQFFDSRYTSDDKREKCILIGVDATEKSIKRHEHGFSIEESLSEMSELVGTAGLMVSGCLVQRLPTPNPKTYIGSGKIREAVDLILGNNVKTLVIDDDLSTKQQRNLEEAFEEAGIVDVKILDRTAIILEIFALHAQSREGQLQVELAMLEYRLTRGPKARGGDYDQGCGFRGPGETKLETDRRVIRDRIVLLKKEINALGEHRKLHRKNREKMLLPVIALVGYTNAGKSTLMNTLSNAGVFAENMLFATLDPTTRKISLPKIHKKSEESPSPSPSQQTPSAAMKGQEVFLTDTVGFISKLPTNLIAAFRATLEEVTTADILLVLCDRSNPVWKKQRETVYQELGYLHGLDKPIIEVWNKIDLLPLPQTNTTADQARSGLKEEEMEQFLEKEMISEKLSMLSFLEKLNSTRPVVVHSSEMNEAMGSSMKKGKHSIMKQKKQRKKVTAKRRKSKNVLEDDYDDEDYYEEEEAEEDYDFDGANEKDSAADGEDDEGNIDNIEISHQFHETRVDSSLPLSSSTSSSLPSSSSSLASKYFIVATSAKKNLGMNELVETIQKVIQLNHQSIEIFIPYSYEDQSILSQIHSQGQVTGIEYSEEGTKVQCLVPSGLYDKLKMFAILQ